MASQGLFAAHGFFASQGLVAAQGFALTGFCFAAQGFFPAQGLAAASLRERAAQGLAALHGAAIAAPLMAAASVPEEISVLVILFSSIDVLR